MLVLTRKPNQSIQIGNSIKINLIRVRGNTIQIGIDAPKDVSILRSELLESGRSHQPATTGLAASTDLPVASDSVGSNLSQHEEWNT